MVVRRGQIWWVAFGEPRGSEPGYRHPALVIQRDEVNASALDTVVVCVLTSNTRLATAPGNTLIPKRASKLPKDSVANASQIATIDKSDLGTLVGTLSARHLAAVDRGIAWFLRLGADEG